MASNESTSTKNRPFRSPTTCQICAESAIYSYYGAVACSSCKMFFKRNAEKNQEELICHFDGHCQITTASRTSCAACRLAKCFEQGMQVELIRGKISTPVQRTTTAANLQLMLPARVGGGSEKDDRDQSTLTVEQWNHLSNITHCYDEHQALSFAQQTIDEQQKLPLKRRFKDNTVEQIMQTFANNVQHLYTKNADFLSLSSSTRSALLRRTMLPVASLSCCFLAQTSHLLTNSAFVQTMSSLYGSTSSHYGRLTAERLDHDAVFVKLIMSLLIFSTFDCSTGRDRDEQTDPVDVRPIVDLQNRYVELTWRYLVHRYDDQQAVRSFSNVLRVLFTMQSSLASIENERYSQMIDHLVQQTQTSLNVSSVPTQQQ